MSPGAVIMTLVVLVMAGTVAYLVVAMVRSIRQGGGKVWKNYALSLSLAGLFFLTWLGHGVAQWQEFTDDQREHGEPPTIGDFAAAFSESTLENWQSEFLQLFSFVVLSALFIHKGSAESKDSDDRMEAALKRIEGRLDALEK